MIVDCLGIITQLTETKNRQVCLEFRTHNHKVHGRMSAGRADKVIRCNTGRTQDDCLSSMQISYDAASCSCSCKA